MGRKTVFLDIDGTLTTFQGVFPDSAREALASAKQNGHEMVLCTGRTATQIYPFLRDSGLFSGLVCGAGAEVRRKGETIYEQYVDPEHLAIFVDFMEKVDASYYLQCRSGLYGTSKITERDTVLFAGDPGTNKEREEIFGRITTDDHPKLRRDVNKFAYYEANADLQTIRDHLGDYFYVMESSFRLTDKSDGEVTIRGITKATGMQIYLDACGLGREDAIAFGDGPNDYEMIDYAGVGVAMGNASDDLKSHADFVTDRVDHDGLKKAFIKLGLIDADQ